MKTTLDIDDRLLADAKAAAARQHTTLTKLIEQGIQLRLRPSPVRARRPNPADIPVFSGKRGMYPEIEPSSNRSLYDAADR